MTQVLYYAFLALLLISVIIGAVLSRNGNRVQNLLSLFIANALVSEAGKYACVWNNIDTQIFYHIYTPLSGIIFFAIFSAYSFGKSHKPVIAAAIVWTSFALLFALYVDSIDHLNNRMILLNGFVSSIISTYCLYRLGTHPGKPSVTGRGFATFTVFLLYNLVSFVYIGLIHELYTAGTDTYEKVVVANMVVNIVCYISLLSIVISHRKTAAQG